MNPHPATEPKTASNDEPLFERLFEFSPDGILVADDQGRIVRVNAPAERMFGYGHGELVNQSIESVVPERFRNAHAFYRRDYIDKLRKHPGAISLESYARRRDGSEFPAEIIVTPVVEAERGPLVFAVIRDITQRKRAESAKQEAGDFLANLTNIIPDPLFVKDAQHRWVLLNDAYCNFMQHYREELIGKSDYDFFPKEEADVFWAKDQLVFDTGLQNVNEERFTATAGSPRIVITKKSLYTSPGGEKYIVGVISDITDRKRAEQLLRERDEQLQSILDNSTAIVYVKDEAGHYLRVNRQFEALFGAGRGQLLGKTDYDFFSKAKADELRANDRKVFESGCTRACLDEGCSIEVEEVVPSKDGPHTYISIKFPLFDADGDPYAVCGISTDITERKRAEEALREREQQLQSILDNSPATISVKDTDGRYLRLNRHLGEAMGATEEQIIGKVIHDLMPKELADVIQAHDREVLECGCPKQFEEVVAQKDGLHTYVATKFPLFDTSGKPYAVCGISTDITERKKAEQELQTREHQLQSILDNSPAVIYIKDLQGKYLKVNRHCAEGLGASEEQIVGKSIHDFFPKELADEICAHEKQVLECGCPKQFEDVTLWQGMPRTTLAIKVPLFDSAGKPYAVCGISTDITERKKAEEALRESEERFRQIAENIHDVFWIASGDFQQILYVSPAYEEVWGRSCHSLYDRPLDWIEGIHPDDRELVNRKFMEALEHRHSFDLEYRVLRPDGSIRFVRDRAFPVLDAAGKPYRVVGIATDFTESQQSREELRMREEQLQSILDNSSSAIYLKDREGRYLRVNRQFEVDFGVPRERVVGSTVSDLFPTKRAERLREIDRKVLESGQATAFEEVIPAADGLHTYISNKFPVLDSAGRPWAVGGILTDITERKRTEAALLLEVMKVLASNLEPQKLFSAVSAGIAQVVKHDYATLALYDPASERMRIQRVTMPEGGEPLVEEMLPVESSPAGYVFTTREPVVLNTMDTSSFPAEALKNAQFLRRWITQGVKSACWLPLLHRGNALGVLIVASKREAAFQEKDVRLLTEVANQIAVALDNALAFRQITDSMDRLAQEKLYLEDELKTEYNFEEIIGESPSLRRVLKTVETVAPTEATVLILGETGTGKELIARAIHNLSPRRGRTLVKLNCAAIPAGLLESELFGHEKGSFTGAIARKIGRLEVATGGTLLLDEIGDIPLELQPKLLRALQEKEFERVGGTRTISADVRVIAATNRDLAQMVQDGRFRRDLFYRLSVIPITIPPLRDRNEDIPLLVHYFLQKHSQRMHRQIKAIPPDVMHALVNWYWPGNVRELENLIERAVILSTGPELRVPLAELRTEPVEGGVDVAASSAPTGGTLEDVEREHILQVLRETKGVIGGPQGAAVRLGIKRTTLNFKLRKLGITRADF